MNNATSDKSGAVKRAMALFVREHGAEAAILALSEVLTDLGPEWQGDAGPAVGVECVLGYSPCRADDWRASVRVTP